MVRRVLSDSYRASCTTAPCEPLTLCANLAIRLTNPATRSLSMAAARKSSRSRGGRKKSSGRKRGAARKRSSSARKSSRGGRKSSARRKGGRKSAARKSSSRSKRGGRKAGAGRKRARSRAKATVARVKRVATGVVHQAADLGERAVDTVTEFVQDRF